MSEVNSDRSVMLASVMLASVMLTSGGRLTNRRRQLDILFICLMSVLAETAMLDIVCDRSTGYQCSNGRCVDLAKVNNSVNDCGDNSDEVSNPCRSPLFSCRNNRCVLLDWVLDGNNDCVDQSDEVKRIGTNCSRVATCCRCDEFVPHSECRHQLCQCVSGYYGNDLGTTCTRRLIGDVCRLVSDCDSAIEFSRCDVNFRCSCDVGYHADDNGTRCSPRSIGDRCSFESDCARIANATCINGSCQCFPGFRRTGSSAFQCSPRLLSDNCTTDVDCSLVPNSHCDDHVCACALGHGPSGDGSCKRRRMIGADCATDVDCSSAVRDGVCIDRKCRCADDHVTSPDGSACAPVAVAITDRREAVAFVLIGAIVVLSAILAAILFSYAFRCYKLETRRSAAQNVVVVLGMPNGAATSSSRQGP